VLSCNTSSGEKHCITAPIMAVKETTGSFVHDQKYITVRHNKGTIKCLNGGRICWFCFLDFVQSIGLVSSLFIQEGLGLIIICRSGTIAASRHAGSYPDSCSHKAARNVQRNSSNDKKTQKFQLNTTLFIQVSVEHTTNVRAHTGPGNEPKARAWR